MGVVWPNVLLAGEDEPAVRAKHLQLWLATAHASLTPEQCAAFLRKVPESLLQRVEGTTGTTWLKMDLDVNFADVMREELGEAAVHRFYIDFTLATFGGSILRPLVQGAIRLSGATPSVAAKWWPRGWEGLFRHCGTLTGEVLEPGLARLTYAQLPLLCTGSPAWVDSLRSALYAVFDLCGVKGEICLNTQLALRRVQLDLRWAAHA